jgi:predicted phage-related endonuclease
MSTSDLTTTAREYREIQAMIKELEAEADALKQQMIREMESRNVESFPAGECTIRWGLYESSRLDSAKLKADHADLYSQYSKKTVSTKFQVA